MNNNRKLGLTISLTACIAFAAGWVTAADHTDNRIVNAFDAVGKNIFGEAFFGASVVSPSPDDTRPAVQIDVASNPPQDDSHPVYLNVFHPPDPNSPVCVTAAQIAVTASGVRIYTDGSMQFQELPLGAPPSPCRPQPDDQR